MQWMVFFKAESSELFMKTHVWKQLLAFEILFQDKWRYVDLVSFTVLVIELNCGPLVYPVALLRNLFAIHSPSLSIVYTELWSKFSSRILCTIFLGFHIRHRVLHSLQWNCLWCSSPEFSNYIFGQFSCF